MEQDQNNSKVQLSTQQPITVETTDGLAKENPAVENILGPPVAEAPHVSNPEPQTSSAFTENATEADKNSQLTNMEVHKHPHHITHKKKWPEYLLEFFMIFFAVFLGFLAENTREHILESNREKEYVKSFYEDLTADENDLQSNIVFLKNQIQEAALLQNLMLNISSKQPANRIYMYLRGITRSSSGLVYPNDRTIVQLRNAGGMRLIKNKGVSDSMVGYYRTAEIIQFLNQDGLINKTALREKSVALMNGDDFAKIVDSTSTIINPPENIYLRKTDPDIINSCLVEVDRIKTLNATLARRIEDLKIKAGRIKDFIKREYHLEGLGGEPPVTGKGDK